MEVHNSRVRRAPSFRPVLETPRQSPRSAAGAHGSSGAAGSWSPAKRWTSSIGRSNRSRRFRIAGTGASAWSISRTSPGLCPAIWMGEVALCRPLRDPHGVVADLKAFALPYPDRLREAVIRRFQWEGCSASRTLRPPFPTAIIHTLPGARSGRSPASRKCSQPALPDQREGRDRSGGAP